MDNQVMEAQRAAKKWNPRKIALRHIVSKMGKIKDKEKILKVAKE